MKNTITIVTIGLVATSFTAATAQHGHSVGKGAKHTIACPVSGDLVDLDKALAAHMYADYKGGRYFFCCKDCPPAFQKSPAKYAAKAHLVAPVKVSIVVDNGFSPTSITVQVGKPVEITFDTKRKGCAAKVVFKELGKSVVLTDGTRTTFSFTPSKPGTISFACPMNMYKGSIVVKK